MSYQSESERARIQALIDTKTAQLAIANETYTKILANEIEEYRFDSNEGSQRARRYKMSELKTQIDSLEAEIERLQRRLKSGGLVSVTLRRQ
jgi:polyhydroxyalkanoate synthesis regulator phasin